MPGAASTSLPVMGWREWVTLPVLQIPWIRAKVDTGALTSALHASQIRHITRDGAPWVAFRVHPLHRDAHIHVEREAALHDMRWVRNSGGQSTERPVILTTFGWDDHTWPLEVTLVGRDLMGFRLLLGRQAIRRRTVVDPSRSWLGRAPVGTVTIPR
jgi:hypothetical protein